MYERERERGKSSRRRGKKVCANGWNIGGVNETGVVVEARQAKGMEGEGMGVCCGVCSAAWSGLGLLGLSAPAAGPHD